MIAWGYTRIARQMAIQKDSACNINRDSHSNSYSVFMDATRILESNNTLYEHALNVTENNDLAHFTLAKDLIDHGEFNDALKHCTEALNNNPYNSRANNIMGLVLKKRGEIY